MADICNVSVLYTYIQILCIERKMLKSTSSPLLLFQNKFMLYHQSFSHFLLFIITLCHRTIFTLRIMFYYRFLCNFVHCKQFFLFEFFPLSLSRKTICVLVCDMMCSRRYFEWIEMNSLRFLFFFGLKIYAFRGEHNWWAEIELWIKENLRLCTRMSFLIFFRTLNGLKSFTAS